MTANEIIQYVADALNLSSSDAKDRIGRSLNVRYKQVTSAIGLAAARRAPVSKAATIGSRFLTFTGIEKVDEVYRKVGTKNILLGELLDTEMTAATVHDEPPRFFSIYSLSPNTVTIQLDCTPTTAFTLYATSLAVATTLTNTDSPAFPESFHDVLIYAVCADEYRRKEKGQLAKEAEDMFNQRLSDLKMFIAKSAYLTVYRGKHAKADGWWDSSAEVE